MCDLALIDKIDGWNKDHWKITQPGNWKEFIAEHDELGVMVWFTNPGGRGNNWNVKIGSGTRLSESTHLYSGLDSRMIALSKAIEFMEKNPDVVWRKREYPNLVTSDGDHIYT